MCFIDLEPCKVFDEHHRKARKPHECSCCYGTIKAGDRYLVHFSVFDGSANANKMCAACEADRSEFAAAHDGMMCVPHDLQLHLRACIGEGDDDEQWKAMLKRIESRS